MIFNSDKKSQPYKTNDIFEAAYLIYKGMPRAGKETYKTETGMDKVFFLFEQHDKCQKLAEEFYESNTCNVNALEYIDRYRNLKRSVFKTFNR